MKGVQSTVNIYEIARIANVSPATVSRVINNKPNISPKTYDRVMQVMSETGFRPNAIARGLASNSMSLIGIIVDDIRNLYRANCVYYLEDGLTERGYNSVVFNGGKKGAELANIIARQQFDALIFVGSSMGGGWVADFVRDTYNQKPVLMFNGELGLPNTMSIICDEYRGMQFIGDHLYRSGYRKPVYVHFKDTPASQRKLFGFRNKLIELNVPFDDSRIFYTSDEGFSGGCEAASHILESGLTFDSIVCSLDLLALGTMYTLRRYGYTIPGDIAVTGFDNLIYGKLSAPFLTSVDGKVKEMSKRAVDMLINALDTGIIENEPIYIAPSLFLGETT